MVLTHVKTGVNVYIQRATRRSIIKNSFVPIIYVATTTDLAKQLSQLSDISDEAEFFTFKKCFCEHWQPEKLKGMNTIYCNDYNQTANATTQNFFKTLPKK